VHFVTGGSTYWVNPAGRKTAAVCLGKWTYGIPAWLRGGWRNRRGEVTFPLRVGGWSNGRGTRALDYGGVTFGTGPSEPLSYYRSIAVDPRLIPFGSRVYVPAYKWTKSHGWFRAVDIGGAIKGKHIDIYRPAPADMSDQGRYLKDQRVLVVPPR
jgi:3D (Asp-Asp-Asp) domain-containing protein